MRYRRPFCKNALSGLGQFHDKPDKDGFSPDAFAVRGIEYAFARGYSADASPCETDLTAEAVALAAEYDEILFVSRSYRPCRERGWGQGRYASAHRPTLRLVSALLSLKKKIAVVLFGGSPVELPLRTA